MPLITCVKRKGLADAEDRLVWRVGGDGVGGHGRLQVQNARGMGVSPVGPILRRVLDNRYPARYTKASL